MAAHESEIGITLSPRNSGAPVPWVVYPEATHAFDGYYPEHHYLGHLIRHDPAATRNAEARVRAFLQANLLVATTDLPPRPTR